MTAKDPGLMYFRCLLIIFLFHCSIGKQVFLFFFFFMFYLFFNQEALVLSSFPTKHTVSTIT